jgi:hypothetical protein
MNHAVVACLSVVFLTPLLLAQTKSSTTKRVFRTESGNRAVIRPVGHTGESVVDFFSPGGGKSCSADYSSADGSHGFIVAKAEWSPDQRYFVFSMQSSGGHQPWHAPTSFYSSDDHALCSLDGFLDPPGIASSDFTLSAPNRITTFVYGQQSPAPTPLDNIRKTGTRNGQPRCVPCNSGTVHEFGDRTMPYEHSPK